MDAQTLKCKNKQAANKQTNEQKNKQTKRQTNKIVQQNLSGLIADMDRVFFLNNRTLPPNDEVPEKSIWARLDDSRAS